MTGSIRLVYRALRLHEDVRYERLESIMNLADVMVYHEYRDQPGMAEAIREIEENPGRRVLVEPSEFIKRTHLSRNMELFLYKIYGALAGKTNVYLKKPGNRVVPVSTRVFILPSLLGGGKTHFLILAYYITLLHNKHRDPAKLYYMLRHLSDDFASNMAKLLEDIGEIKVVSIIGEHSVFAPTPGKTININGYEIRTPWGIFFYQLGLYEKYRKLDEEIREPLVDEIKEALRGKHVLILIDEPVTLISGGRGREIRGAFINFIRNLAQAVNETPYTALVISIPAEFQGQVIGRAEHDPEAVMEIYKQVRRANPDIIPPLEIGRDIVHVLIKRIFDVSEDERKKIAREITKKIEEHLARDTELRESMTAKYGDISEYRRRIINEYPYHPYFIEFLVELGTRYPDLARTRWLLAFVAKVINKIYTHEVPVSLITLWSIPLDDPDIRGQLLQGEAADHFRRVYEEDVVKAPRQVQGASLVEAAKIVSRTIWLTTLLGGGYRSSDAMKKYPRLMDLPIIVYEPYFYEKIGMASTIYNALESLKAVSPHLVVDDGRVFYAYLPNITSYIREKYLATDKNIALQEFQRLLAIYTDTNRQRRLPGRVFDKVIPILNAHDIVLEQVRREIEKTDKPVLLIYYAFSQPPDELYRLLKRNNIVLVVRDYNIRVEEHISLRLNETLRGLIGREPETIGELLESMLRLNYAIRSLMEDKDFLARLVGEANIEIIKRKLSEIKKSVEEKLSEAILRSLRYVYIGVKRQNYDLYSGGLYGLYIQGEALRTRLENLPVAIASYLMHQGIRTEWTWDGLLEELLKIRGLWDNQRRIIPNEEIGQVKKIWDYLLTNINVYPHLTKFEGYVKALEEGYARNNIAFIAGGEIIWLMYPVAEEMATGLRRNMYGYYLDLEYLRGKIRSHSIPFSQWVLTHPVYIVEEFVKKIVEKEGEVRSQSGRKAIRRIFILREDREYFFREYVETNNDPDFLAEDIPRSIVFYRVEYPEITFNLSIDTVNGEPYKDQPVRLEFEGRARIRITGEIMSEEYPYPITLRLEVRDDETGEIIRIKTDEVSLGEFTVETYIDKPGSYKLLLSAVGGDLRKYMVPPRVVAEVIVKGETCKTINIRGNEIPEKLPILKERFDNIGIVEVDIPIPPSPNQALSVKDLLVLANRLSHEFRVDLTVKAKYGEMVIDVSLSKAPVMVAGKLYSMITEILIKPETMVETFLIRLVSAGKPLNMEEASQIIDILSDKLRLAEISNIVVEACRRI